MRYAGWLSMRRYHEILPGVGAFTLRPDFVNGETTAVGTASLKEFIEDVLLIQKNHFSQLYRVNYWTHETTKESPGIYAANNIIPDRSCPPADTEVLAGWVRDEATAQLAKENRLFYFHAIEDDGKVTKLDPKVFSARYIIPYTEKTGLGWYAAIEGCRLASGRELVDKIGGRHNCLYYYLLTLGEPVEMQPIDLTNIIVSLRDRRPVVTKWDKLFREGR
ncbi:MAG: hypothetical protein HW382_1228 [Deltaproteobacteria bacterium]|nr:hypothetical protein [Deltaproteobacteria bacterium]